jgi:hypothetical protein
MINAEGAEANRKPAGLYSVTGKDFPVFFMKEHER